MKLPKIKREEEGKIPIYQEPYVASCPNTGVCPSCKKGKLIRLYTITVSGAPWEIPPEMGCIYECDVCGKYFVYDVITKRFREISYFDIVHKIRELIEFLNAVKEYKPTAQYEPLSPALATLTYPDPLTGEYWTVDEIYKACHELGFDPATADWNTTPWIVAYLRENYPKGRKIK